ncbi:hypothetical protein CDD83_6076 [Cordyceps sp. RAO-2017]|nr:hypothetical protein CDD83_6076 [Cordyceps sp. RAO-2017]
MERDSHVSAAASSTPGSFEHSHSVEEFNVSIPEYMRQNASISGLMVSAVVFGGTHVLLIQRASHDFAPLMWEVPGGACEAEQDKTVLHALARELFEETALHLRRVNRRVDQVEFGDTRADGFIWRKVTFEVDVEEGDDRDVIGAAVRLDPAEHQDWGWAQMAEVDGGQWGKGQLRFSDSQRTSILTAFRR